MCYFPPVLASFGLPTSSPGSSRPSKWRLRCFDLKSFLSAVGLQEQVYGVMASWTCASRAPGSSQAAQALYVSRWNRMRMSVLKNSKRTRIHKVHETPWSVPWVPEVCLARFPVSVQGSRSMSLLWPTSAGRHEAGREKPLAPRAHEVLLSLD